MFVWFSTLGRPSRKAAPLGQPGTAHGLTAAVVGITLLSLLIPSVDRSDVESVSAGTEPERVPPTDSI